MSPEERQELKQEITGEIEAQKRLIVSLEETSNLGKVDHPDFGICTRCENPIPWGRIKVMPENVLCVPCAEKR